MPFLFAFTTEIMTILTFNLYLILFGQQNYFTARALYNLLIVVHVLKPLTLFEVSKLASIKD